MRSAASALKPKEKGRGVWDLVNFVQALPYPQMIKEADADTYHKIFGPVKRGEAAGGGE